MNPTALTTPTIIKTADRDYDEARSAWNLFADLRPAAVATATSTAEVQAAVRLAAARGLRIAPFTTGHLATALPDLADVLLLRTELSEPVTIDAAARRARVPAGAVWEDVVVAAAEHGLAALHGSSPDVGVVGYLLGGGLSFYAREHGLAANHVHAVELVTADGSLVRADAQREPELFWALRGGGGNFGVVCAVEIELFELTEVFAGMTAWPIADAEAVLSTWLAWTREAPSSVTTSARLLRLPPLPDVPEPLRGVPVVAVDGAALDTQDGEELLTRLQAAAEPLLDTWAPVPPEAVLRVHGDPEHPVPGIGEHTLLGELDEEALGALLDVAGDGADCPLLFVELRQLGGALAITPEDAGARGRLEGRFALMAVGLPMEPAMVAPIQATMARLRDALRTWDTGRVFLSFAEHGGSARSCFGGLAYARLRGARDHWDPQRRLVASHDIA